MLSSFVKKKASVDIILHLWLVKYFSGYHFTRQINQVNYFTFVLADLLSTGIECFGFKWVRQKQSVRLCRYNSKANRCNQKTLLIGWIKFSFRSSLNIQHPGITGTAMDISNEYILLSCLSTKYNLLPLVSLLIIHCSFCDNQRSNVKKEFDFEFDPWFQPEIQPEFVRLKNNGLNITCRIIKMTPKIFVFDSHNSTCRFTIQHTWRAFNLL